MRKLIVFNSGTADGYFTDKNNDMSWVHRQDDAEWNDFVAENARSGGELVWQSDLRNDEKLLAHADGSPAIS